MLRVSQKIKLDISKMIYFKLCIIKYVIYTKVKKQCHEPPLLITQLQQSHEFPSPVSSLSTGDFVWFY